MQAYTHALLLKKIGGALHEKRLMMFENIYLSNMAMLICIWLLPYFPAIVQRDTTLSTSYLLL